jgi:glutathione S-transferase
MSTCTRRVGLIAKERNVPYEVVTVKLAEAEHKQPPYLQHQPFGQIPYIVVRRRFPLPHYSEPAVLLCAICSFNLSVAFLARRWL